MTVPISSLFYDDDGPHLLSSPPRTSRGDRLKALLATGIAGLGGLDSQPFSKPAVIEDESVPIEDLLYRGRAALARAMEIRDAVRTRNTAPDQSELDELFDLLDLAASE